MTLSPIARAWRIVQAVTAALPPRPRTITPDEWGEHTFIAEVERRALAEMEHHDARRAQAAQPPVLRTTRRPD